MPEKSKKMKQVVKQPKQEDETLSAAEAASLEAFAPKKRMKVINAAP